ncbi:MAG: Phosphoglycolate phosphatase [Anaerolineae bacterium]|nr:Phosphoglycolate phosphatase [Anaerolineae bacterium]
MSINAITFDFWQTLYKNRPVDHSARLYQLKADIERGSGQSFTVEQIKAAVGVARDTWSRTWAIEHRTLSAHEWLTVMLAALETSIPATHLHDIETRMENSLLEVPPEPVTEIAAVLPALAARYRLGVISDTGLTPGRVLRQILETDGFAGYFTQLTFSDEIGRSKPHPDAFLITLDKLNAAPEQAVHIGDLLRTDVLGAQGVGMRGVQYVGVSRDDWSMGQAYPPETEVIPDAVIASHTELLPLLARWNGAG